MSTTANHTKLETLIDRGFTVLIETLIGGLTAKEGNGQPGATPKQLTEALEAAVEWADTKRRGHSDGDGFGTALGGGKR